MASYISDIIVNKVNHKPKLNHKNPLYLHPDIMDYYKLNENFTGVQCNFIVKKRDKFFFFNRIKEKEVNILLKQKEDITKSVLNYMKVLCNEEEREALITLERGGVTSTTKTKVIFSKLSKKHNIDFVGMFGYKDKIDKCTDIYGKYLQDRLHKITKKINAINKV